MTTVTRITLFLLITTVTFGLDSYSADAQIFRRLRDNIRYNRSPPRIASPLRVPQPSISKRPPNPGATTKTKPVPKPQQPAIAKNKNTQFNPPIAKRRSSTAKQPFNNRPQSSTGADIVADESSKEANVESLPIVSEGSATVKVRVVTYLDPKTGRKITRRYLIPKDAAPSDQQSELTASPAIRKQRVDAGPKKLTPYQHAVPRFTIVPASANEPSGGAARPLINSWNDSEQSGPPIIAPGQVAASEDKRSIFIDQEVSTETAVMPASAGEVEIGQPGQIGVFAPDSVDETFSVLEKIEAPQSPLPIKVELDPVPNVDEVEDFFGSNN